MLVCGGRWAYSSCQIFGGATIIGAVVSRMVINCVAGLRCLPQVSVALQIREINFRATATVADHVAEGDGHVFRNHPALLPFPCFSAFVLAGHSKVRFAGKGQRRRS